MVQSVLYVKRDTGVNMISDTLPARKKKVFFQNQVKEKCGALVNTISLCRIGVPKKALACVSTA